MTARAVFAIFLLVPAAASAEGALPRHGYKHLRKLHRGGGPCLRYGGDPSLGQDVLRPIARKLLAADVDVETLQKVLFYFIEQAEETENKAHQLPEREEIRAAMLEEMSPAEKEAATRTPGPLERRLDQAVAWRKSGVAEARAAFKRLSTPASAALMELRGQHPEAFYLQNFLHLRDVMRAEEGADRLRRAGQFVLDVYTKTGHWPEVLPSNLSLIDGEDVHYYRETNRVVLSCPSVAPASWLEVVKGGARPYKPGPCRGARKGSMSKAELQEWIDDAGPKTRIEPVFDEKTRAITGFMLVAFEPGSFVDRIGFCEGDVVVRAGAHDLTSPRRAQEASIALRDASTVVFTVLRGGQKIELEIQQRE